MPNFTFAQALNAYNADQVMTQTMWYIQVFPPTNYTSQGGPELDKMQIYGQNFTVPGRTNEFTDVNYRGYNIPTPTVLKMDQDHSVTINCDVDQHLRRGFLAWQSCAIDATIGPGPGFTSPASFQSDRRPTAGVGSGKLGLYLLAPDYQTIEMGVNMYGVRVASVGSITLSHSDGGIATFEVQFKSVYWQLNRRTINGAASNVDKVGGKALGGDYQPSTETKMAKTLANAQAE